MLKTAIKRRIWSKTGKNPPDQPAAKRVGAATIHKVAGCKDRRCQRQFGVDEWGNGV
jgi:hypothetical protein